MTTSLHLNEAILPANAATLSTYYKSVEKGEFLQILDTLADDVEYVISGNPALLPFAGSWKGKEKVTELFKAFGSAFQLLDLKENIVIQCSDRVISCNDESFAVFRTGRFYRVPVLHIAEFNAQNRIARFINIHDTSTAEQAFDGRDSALVPIMPKPQTASGSEISEAEAVEIAQALKNLLFGVPNEAEAHLLKDMRLYVPGLPSRDGISGVWTGALLADAFPARLTQFKRDRAIGPDDASIDRVTLDAGQIAIEGRLGGTDAPWVVAATLQGKTVGSAALFFDFAAS